MCNSDRDYNVMSSGAREIHCDALFANRPIVAATYTHGELDDEAGTQHFTNWRFEFKTMSVQNRQNVPRTEGNCTLGLRAASSRARRKKQAHKGSRK